MKNIRLIAWNTIREFLASRIIYLLVFLALLVFSSVGNELSSIAQDASSAGSHSIFLRQVRVLTVMLMLWIDLIVIGVIVFASGIVRKEQQSKTLPGVMAKPVARWEFLLGKWSGLQLFFAAFFGAGFLIAVLFMWYWNIPLSGLFWVGLVHKMMLVAAYTTVAFVLSLFMPRMPGGGIALMLFIVGPFNHFFIFERMMDSSYPFLQKAGAILHYASPALLKRSLIMDGLVQNILHPKYGLFWSVIAENFFYSALLFFVGALFFQKRDLLSG